MLVARICRRGFECLVLRPLFKITLPCVLPIPATLRIARLSSVDTPSRCFYRPMATWSPSTLLRTPHRATLLAMSLKAQILAEKRHHVVLETDSDGAGMCSLVNLEGIRDAIPVENFVQLGGINA